MTEENGNKTEKKPEEKTETAESNLEQAPDSAPKATGEAEAEASANEAVSKEPSPAWEAELDEYPLRPPEEDATWAIRTVQTWLGFALFSIAFVLVMLILGFFYD